MVLMSKDLIRTHSDKTVKAHKSLILDEWNKEKNVDEVFLQRKIADLMAQYEFINRKAVYLSHKDVITPCIESIQLTETEKRFLNELHKKKMKDIVMKTCSIVLKQIMGNKLALPFNHPVDVNIYQDYLQYISEPMDFTTIKTKLSSYETPEEFEKDVRTIFTNARKYNAQGSDIRIMADTLEEKFNDKWAKLVMAKILDLERGEGKELQEFKQCKSEKYIFDAETKIDWACKILIKKMEELMKEVKYLKCLAATKVGVLTHEERFNLTKNIAELENSDCMKVSDIIIAKNPSLLTKMNNNIIHINLLNNMDYLSMHLLQDFVNKRNRKRNIKNVNNTEPKSKRIKKHYEDNLKIIPKNIKWPDSQFGIGLKPLVSEIDTTIPFLSSCEPGHMYPNGSSNSMVNSIDIIKNISNQNVTISKEIRNKKNVINGSNGIISNYSCLDFYKLNSECNEFDNVNTSLCGNLSDPNSFSDTLFITNKNKYSSLPLDGISILPNGNGELLSQQYAEVKNEEQSFPFFKMSQPLLISTMFTNILPYNSIHNQKHSPLLLNISSPSITYSPKQSSDLTGLTSAEHQGTYTNTISNNQELKN